MLFTIFCRLNQGSCTIQRIRFPVLQLFLLTIQNTRYSSSYSNSVIVHAGQSLCYLLLFVQQVTVAIIDLSPDFSYVSVPKKSPLSFLQAKVKNVSSYAFLTGPANVFLDNNFLAKVFSWFLMSY